jgi:hypothetical protein
MKRRVGKFRTSELAQQAATVPVHRLAGDMRMDRNLNPFCANRTLSQGKWRPKFHFVIAPLLPCILRCIDSAAISDRQQLFDPSQHSWRQIFSLTFVLSSVGVPRGFVDDDLFGMLPRLPPHQRWHALCLS